MKVIVKRSLLFLSVVWSFQFTDAESMVKNTPELKDIHLPEVLILLSVVALVAYLLRTVMNFQDKLKESETDSFDEYIKDLEAEQIDIYLEYKKRQAFKENSKKEGSKKKLTTTIAALLFLSVQSMPAAAQGTDPGSLFSQPGILITIVLLILPVVLGIWYALARVQNSLKQQRNKEKYRKAEKFAEYLKTIDNPELDEQLAEKRNALTYSLNNDELSGNASAIDTKGILNRVSNDPQLHFTAFKKKAAHRPALPADVTKLIIWYLGLSVFWLVLGSGIGEYLGIKFVAPEADSFSWLSFGRLRPVHTNIVFWGWASLAMIGLGYYVIPIVSNTKIYSIKWGWIALILTNIMIVSGSACLMAGINNGGGEFREYIWPVMAFFAGALILTLANFIMTVAKRSTKEIYISNWYMVSALIFTIIVALTAYLPFWQNGIGETIVQGYFMHSGVGMWFTLYTLGLLYYFIPQQLNKPIYSYSLGILAFWTQILFYTIIGTHHFIFSAIPWWLQTVAIVGSMGMIIPVLAATINYFMTFKGQWHKVASSYTLPFFLVAVVYYFIVSFQGTAEAFRFTNLLWHFTDFTVGHAHLGFYGIITFALWGGMYVVIPRLTGNEPPQSFVGAHFWLAFIGVIFYAVPLSIGGTLRGMMWMEGKPFIDSVVMMFDYWLWRAIGGSLMFLSHIVFAYNFYKMVKKPAPEVDVKAEAIKKLELITEY